MSEHEANISEELIGNLVDDWDSAAAYLSIFIDEAQTTLDELTEAMLKLEAGGGRENVEQLFISAHRIKGSAASIGLNRPARLAHLMEDLLQPLAGEGRTLGGNVADALLAAIDGLRLYIDAIRNGQPEGDRFEELARNLVQAGRAELGDAGERPAASAASNAAANEAFDMEELHARVAAVVEDDHRAETLVGRIVFEPELPLVGLKAQLVHAKLSNLGDICYFSPPADSIADLDSLDSIKFGLVTDKKPEAVRSQLRVAGIQEMIVEPLAEIAPTAEAAVSKSDVPAGAGAAKTADSGPKPAETLRVNVERLDELMSLAGELAICKSRVTQIGLKLRESTDSGDHLQTRASINDLFEAIHQIDRVSDDLQRSVLNTRMLPIGPLFSRFHRVIRDMTRSNGKIIRLSISGESTELDKRMIDELGDPLIHMIRNAADHGIETPEERQAAGKPAHGTISLDAFHRGSNIMIRVSDDGRGLDAGRLREKVVAMGLVSASDAERMTPQQLHQYIWLPGVSTARQVSEVSGRGVGMDLVRTQIEELNGSIDVQSEPGKGVVFTLKLPLTLAILPSLMIEIERDGIAVPLESVVRIVHVAPADVLTVQGSRVVSLRDGIVSLLALDEIFRDPQGRSSHRTLGAEGTTMVILGEGDRRLGLAVDRVLGEEDVVIKSLADNFRNVAGFAGASVLGDGRVALILDPPSLIEMSTHPSMATSIAKEHVL